MAGRKMRLACGALALGTPLLLGNTATAGFESRLLAAQNQERAALGIEPLAWDPALARSAQGWADHLAATGGFAHAPKDMRAPEGENLWAGTRGRYALEDMVSAWAREKRYFRPAPIPAASTTGRFADVGHFTQLVWRATRRVGCALATGAREDVLVCRYAEAGNWVGEKPF